MSSGDSPKKPGGWRQGGNKGGPPAAGRYDGPAWKGSPGDTAGPVTLGRGLKLTLGIATLTALLVGLFALIIMFRPQTPANIFVIGADYADTLAVPPNAHGWQALADLNDWTKAEQKLDGTSWLQFLLGARRVFTTQTQPASLTAAGLDQLQADLARARDRCAIVVVLSAHAAVDDRGVYFVPARPRLEGATLLDPNVRIHLDKIVELLRQANRPQQDKVLILDLAPLPAWLPLGLCHNDVAAELRAEVARLAKDERLFVLASMDRDEVSWSSDELRRSVFLHAVLEGLRRGCDLADGHVTLARLTDFVRSQVTAWAQKNRRASQQPMLLTGLADEATAQTGTIHPDASRAAENVYLCFSKQAAESLKPASLPALDRWRAAWELWHRLAQRQPPPWTYQPETWRCATAWLRRYEELILAGSSAAEQALKLAEGELRKLEPPLEATQAVYASLASPVALAVTGPSSEEHRQEEAKDRERVDRLLQASGEAFDAEAQKILAEVKDHELRFLTVLQQTLLDRLQRVAADELRKECLAAIEILKRLGRMDQLPQEMQIVRLLTAYDLPGAPPYDGSLVRLLLQVQRAAGDAGWGRWDAVLHPAQQRYQAVIQPFLVEADQVRRQGEDNFFAGDTDQARKHLQAALEQYQAIRRDFVLPLAEAYAVRDELFMRLPWLTAWSAGPRDVPTALPPSAEYVNELDRTADAVSRLWEHAHQLTADLQQLSSTPPRREEAAQLTQRIRDLLALARQAKRALEDLLTQAYQEADRLTDRTRPRERTQTDWHALDNLLHVPFFPVQKREDLLRRRHEISDELQETSQQPSGASPREGVARPGWDGVDLKKSALRRARLLLAMLGAELYDAVAEPAAAGRFQVCQQGVTTASLDDKQWQGTLRRALTGVGKVNNYWPKFLQQNLDQARTKRTLPETLAALRLADRSGRLLDPAALPAGAAMPTAADELRRLQTGTWLLFQCQRVLDDFWADGDRTVRGDPYFARRTAALIDDARKLLTPRGVRELPPSRADDVAKLESMIRDRQRARLQLALTGLKTGEPLRWTTETERILRYELAAEGPVPLGRPHARLASRQERPWLRTLAEAKTFELTAPDRRPISDFRVERDESTRRPGDETEELQLETWYRGHRWTLATPVRLYPEPDIAWNEQVPPAKGFVSVRMTPAVADRFGTNNNGLVVILDCSGSMYDHKDPGKPRPSAATLQTSPDTRFFVAKEAVKRMLLKIPEQTQVSVWTFSQMLGTPVPVEAGGESYLRPREGDEIARVNETIRPLVPMQAWSARLAQAACQKIDSLVAYNETPLVRAILKARDDLRDIRGFKTIIVLTDGMDNRIDKDNELNPDRISIPDLLKREFGPNSPYRDIKLVIVGFQLPKDQKVIAEQNFKSVLQKEVGKDSDYLSVERQDVLEQVLQESCRRELRFQIQDAITGQELPLTKTLVEPVGRRDPVRHELRPGSYRAVVLGHRQAFELGNGEHLMLDVDVGTGDRLVFRRAVWTDDLDSKEFKDDAGWRLSVVHQAAGGAATAGGPAERQLWVTLEGMENRERSPNEFLMQPQPRFVWHDLRSTSTAAPPPRQLSWTNQPLLPAAAWQVFARWPSKTEMPGKLEWTTWYAVNNPPAFHTLSRRTSERFDDWQQRQRGPIPLEGSSEPVVLDSISLEKHALKFPGDDPQAPLRDWLVIRLSFPPGKPIFAQLNQRVPARHELYTEAGRYVGYFQLPNVENSLESVAFYSVESLKSDRRLTRQIKVLVSPPAAGTAMDPPFDLPH